jgi:hypothetical protein
MKGTMVIIPVAGPETRIELDAPPESEAIHDAVGGHIEMVPYFTEYETPDGPVDCIAFCNEEGKLHNPPLAYNNRANEIWNLLMVRKHGRSPHPDYLVGNVVILYGDAELMEAL